MNHVPFSIIIPAYGTADYIEECLDSIESQTYFRDNDNFEVVVGVDGCPATLQKLKEIGHKYRNLRVFYGNNRGSYVTVNSLLREVRHENIIKFDSDDIMKPFLVETLTDRNRVGRYGLINFTMLDFEKEKNKIIRCSVAKGVFFFHKHMLDYLGGFKPWICNADIDFTKRADRILNMRIRKLKKPLFWRRVRPDSLTQSPKTRGDSHIRKQYRKQIFGVLEYVTPVIHDEWEQVFWEKVVTSKLCIVTAYTPIGDWKKMGELTTATKREYADRHNYALRVFTEGFDDSRHPAWSKLNFIKETLKEYEWVWWIDSDAAITNHKKTIDKFLDMDVDIIIGREKGPPFNTGSFLIRSCDFSFWVLDEVWKDKDWKKRSSWEQDGLAQLYRDGKLGKRIKIFPCRELNGFLDWRPSPHRTRGTECQQWHVGDLVAHCVGGSVNKMSERISRLKQAINLTVR